MEKKKYDALKDIEKRLKAGQKTTFQERNFYNINLKKRSKIINPTNLKK